MSVRVKTMADLWSCPKVPCPTHTKTNPHPGSCKTNVSSSTMTWTEPVVHRDDRHYVFFVLHRFLLRFKKMFTFLPAIWEPWASSGQLERWLILALIIVFKKLHSFYFQARYPPWEMSVPRHSFLGQIEQQLASRMQYAKLGILFVLAWHHSGLLGACHSWGTTNYVEHKLLGRPWFQHQWTVTWMYKLSGQRSTFECRYLQNGYIF